MRQHPARPTLLRRLLPVLGLAGLGLLVTGCEVTESSQTYRSGPMCPQIYDPVCAERWGEERTFPNACEARVAGWRIVANAQCRSDRYPDYRNDRDRYDRDRDYRCDRYDPRSRDRDRPSPPPPVRPKPPAPPPPPPVRPAPPPPPPPAGACPQVYDRVCGQLGNTTGWYMNRCELQRAGAIEVAAGLCMGGNR